MKIVLGKRETEHYTDSQGLKERKKEIWGVTELRKRVREIGER